MLPISAPRTVRLNKILNLLKPRHRDRNCDLCFGTQFNNSTKNDTAIFSFHYTAQQWRTWNQPAEARRKIFHSAFAAITPGYGAGVQLEFFVVITTKKAYGTEVAHEPIVSTGQCWYLQQLYRFVL
jgi:hypothetical protein